MVRLNGEVRGIPSPHDRILFAHNTKVIQFPPQIGVNTDYVLVYGTLRKGGSNYRLLKDAEYCGTFPVLGFQLGTGLNCRYTGHPGDATMMDLFYLGHFNATAHAEHHLSLDSLEGTRYDGYQTTIVPISHNGSLIQAKMYQILRGSDLNASGDIKNRNYSDQLELSNEDYQNAAEKCVYITEEANRYFETAGESEEEIHPAGRHEAVV